MIVCWRTMHIQKVEAAEAVILAMPYPAVDEVLTEIGDALERQGPDRQYQSDGPRRPNGGPGGGVGIGADPVHLAVGPSGPLLLPRQLVLLGLVPHGGSVQRLDVELVFENE